MTLFHKYREQIAYLFFGGITTIVSMGSYALFVHFGIIPVASRTLSWMAAVAVAFFTNRWWVFESKATGFKSILKEAITFVSSRILTGIFEIASLPILMHLGFDGIIFATPGMDAVVLVSIIVVIGNYFIGKFWVFKSKKEK